MRPLSAGSLLRININVTKTSVVGDTETDIVNEFSKAWDENDLVVVTGGLGPTHDDITRKCIVNFFNTELVKNTEVLEDIKLLFRKRGRKITKI